MGRGPGTTPGETLAPARGPCASHPAAPRVAQALAKFAGAAAGPPRRPATAAGRFASHPAGRPERQALLSRARRTAGAGLGRASSRAPQAASPQPEPRPASERPGRGRRRCADPSQLSSPYRSETRPRAGMLGPVTPSPPLPPPPAATGAGWLRRPRKGPPRPRGSKVPALTVGHAQQQGVQQQRRQASEGAEPVPLFHLPRGARRRAPGRGQAAVAAAWARIPLALGLGRPRACHGPARRALPRPPAAANQPSSLAGWPGAAPAGGAARGVQNARSRLEATGDRSVRPSTPPSAGRWGTAVQSVPGAPGRGWAAPGPISSQGSARLGAANFRLSVAWFGS